MNIQTFVRVGIFLVITGLVVSVRYFYQKSTELKEETIRLSTVAKQYNAELTMLQARQNKLAELDQYHTGKLNEAEYENKTLRAQLASGDRRMLLSGTSPCRHKEPPATARRVGDDATIELTADTGQRILSVREGIIRDRQKIMYLQQYIRQVCLPEPAVQAGDPNEKTIKK